MLYDKGDRIGATLFWATVVLLVLSVVASFWEAQAKARFRAEAEFKAGLYCAMYGDRDDNGRLARVYVVVRELYSDGTAVTHSGDKVISATWKVESGHVVLRDDYGIKLESCRIDAKSDALIVRLGKRDVAIYYDGKLKKGKAPPKLPAINYPIMGHCAGKGK